MLTHPDHGLQVNQSLCFLLLESSGISVNILPVLLSVYVHICILNEQTVHDITTFLKILVMKLTIETFIYSVSKKRTLVQLCNERTVVA